MSSSGGSGNIEGLPSIVIPEVSILDTSKLSYLKILFAESFCKPEGGFELAEYKPERSLSLRYIIMEATKGQSEEWTDIYNFPTSKFIIIYFQNPDVKGVPLSELSPIDRYCHLVCAKTKISEVGKFVLNAICEKYEKWSEINRKRFIGIERVYECEGLQIWRAIIRKEEEKFVDLQALHRDASLPSDIIYGGSNIFCQVLPEIKFKDLKIRYMINRCHVVSEDKDFQLNTRVFKDSDYFRRRITLRIYYNEFSEEVVKAIDKEIIISNTLTYEDIIREVIGFVSECYKTMCVIQKPEGRGQIIQKHTARSYRWDHDLTERTFKLESLIPVPDDQPNPCWFVSVDGT